MKALFKLIAVALALFSWPVIAFAGAPIGHFADAINEAPVTFAQLHPVLFEVLVISASIAIAGGALTLIWAAIEMVGKDANKSLARRFAMLSVTLIAVGVGSYAWATDSTFTGNGRGGPASYAGASAGVSIQPACIDSFRGRLWALYSGTAGTGSDKMQICGYGSSGSGTFKWVSIPAMNY